MGRDRAAYMREYRSAKRLRAVRDGDGRPTGCSRCVHCEARITELEADVRHLKAELAKRPFQRGVFAEDGMPDPILHQFSSRPFTPVPKGKTR